MLNRYLQRSQISKVKFRQITNFFGMFFTVTDIIKLTVVNFRCINSEGYSYVGMVGVEYKKPFVFSRQ